MFGKLITFFMKKNIQKIILGTIVVVAGLIMLKKYTDGKKKVVKESKEVNGQYVKLPKLEQPVAVVDADVQIEQDPIKDLGQAPMEMPDDSQYVHI